MATTLEACLKILAADPRSTEAINGLGRFFAERNLTQEAGTCFRHVLEIDPRNTEAMNSLGALVWQEFDLWYQTGAGRVSYYATRESCIAEAMDWCEKVLAVDPNNPEAIKNLGEYSEARFNLNRAIFAQEHEVT
ncbi:hypothetical protein DB347_08710 [Opitutaceae bacterium EW11]|nr:hypothetical protein DB347_08710 [Opitutaceae bacterium EW11]